jgi:predicted SnoaL-like aldol condensation-catalyzing enzyme
MTLTGKGYFIWMVKQCENGNPDRIAALAKESNLSHVLIKIADGVFPYNVNPDTEVDEVKPVIEKLHEQGIAVWGWHYIYGQKPKLEADAVVIRARELGIDGFVVNAEKAYEDSGNEKAAEVYMKVIRENFGSMPIALSSYRYPSFHPNLPWAAFLEYCDYTMPQVYWVQSHNNAGEQLLRCVEQYQEISPFRPIIPTGPTFKESGWIPYKDEIVEFFQTAQQLGLSAVNFWYWDGARRYLPKFWDLVGDYPFATPEQHSLDIQRYITALNSRSPESLLRQFADDAVQIRTDATVQGKAAIKAWYSGLLQDFPGGQFQLLKESRQDDIINLTWEITSSAGHSLTVQDTLRMDGGKIKYQYSFSKPC